MRNDSTHWSLACHLDYGENGTAVSIIEHANGVTTVHRVPSSPATGKPAGYRPIYLGVTADRQAILLDPETKAIGASAELAVDSVAHYAYPEPGTRRFWYTNDGDEETGNDVLNCGESGASMTVIEAQADGLPKFIKTICVGRGHHVPSFTAPDDRHPQIKRRAYVSNLQDGTISVIGNDPGDKSSYLSVLGSINLCEPEKEKGGAGVQVPNNAFPHGQAYSARTGRLYGLNNGYGTVAVIDPVNNRIVSRVEFKVSSNLLLSPDGRFLIGKGADRKRDPEHVIGRLTVMDADSGGIVSALDIADVYPSTYRFNADGSRLYVTTAATGKGIQRELLAIDKVLVYDATVLPRLDLINELKVGKADCGRRPIAFLVEGGKSRRVFIPNPTDGTLCIVDGSDDRVIEVVTISDRPIEELNFSLLGAEGMYGC
jgi:DNA-binding beta-propeller fold protein YncE